MTQSMVRIETAGAAWVIALDRPPVNAINLELADALFAAVAAARDDDACRAIVVTGREGVFSAGIDHREVPAYDAATRARMLRTINRGIHSLYALPKPLVVAVSGHALGAGLVLALTGDLRLAARGEFRLGLTEAKAGIPFPAGPMTVVQAELPPDLVRVLCLTSAVGDPESHLLGRTIDRVVAHHLLRGEAIREALELAAQPGFRAVKRQVRAATAARLADIVARDDEPLLAGWL
ncbi:MAG: enoyl-CoA hydratase/isomerase family protein [Candidatus Binatia bacterium]